MKIEDITDAYFHLGALNKDGKVETPHLTDGDKKIAFEIRCRVCHKGLCKLITIAKSPRKRQNMIFVEPCPVCSGNQDKEIKLNDDWKSNQKEDVA